MASKLSAGAGRDRPVASAAWRPRAMRVRSCWRSTGSRCVRLQTSKNTSSARLSGSVIASLAEQPDEPVALARLVVLDDLAAGMLCLAQLNGSVGDGTAAINPVGENLLDVAHPAIDLSVGIARKRCRELFPQRVAVLGQFAQIRGDELVLGTEMPIQSHLVRGGSFRDRIDPDRTNTVLVEEVASRSQDPLARRNLGTARKVRCWFCHDLLKAAS